MLLSWVILSASWLSWLSCIWLCVAFAWGGGGARSVCLPGQAAAAYFCLESSFQSFVPWSFVCYSVSAMSCACVVFVLAGISLSLSHPACMRPLDCLIECMVHCKLKTAAGRLRLIECVSQHCRRHQRSRSGHFVSCVRLTTTTATAAPTRNCHQAGHVHGSQRCRSSHRLELVCVEGLKSCDCTVTLPNATQCG